MSVFKKGQESAGQGPQSQYQTDIDLFGRFAVRYYFSDALAGDFFFDDTRMLPAAAFVGRVSLEDFNSLCRRFPRAGDIFVYESAEGLF